MMPPNPPPAPPAVPCACGWPRPPLIAVTCSDGKLPTEPLLLSYACPACGAWYAAEQLGSARFDAGSAEADAFEAAAARGSKVLRWLKDRFEKEPLGMGCLALLALCARCQHSGAETIGQSSKAARIDWCPDCGTLRVDGKPRRAPTLVRHPASVTLAKTVDPEGEMSAAFPAAADRDSAPKKAH